MSDAKLKSDWDWVEELVEASGDKSSTVATVVAEIRAELREFLAAELRKQATEYDERYDFGLHKGADIIETFGVEKP